MKNIFAVAFLLFTISFTVKKNGYAVGNKIKNDYTDTIRFSDTCYQVLYWKDSKLESICLFNKSHKIGKYISAQYLDFYPNGVIKECRIINNPRLEQEMGNKVHVYQENVIRYNNLGDVLFCKIKKDHQTVVSYQDN